MTAGAEWKDLFHAAQRGDVELARFQLESGVDPNFIHPEMQSTVLVEACLAGSREIAHLLLDHGADPTVASAMEETTPLAAAHRAGLDDVVLRLRSLGAREPAPVAQPRGGLLARVRRGFVRRG
ncbi:ankyrin repeat domain-containing protein [Nocardioides daphniae]|uniref:Ankyrin repeat domain-containing protein n=1 Tax=Nocardioides daphniae TaxID=402297 RepID=A0ABQ1QI70_9ACTN|nr:ankyrin repeat domain-containing protein [Nocardioides daphniae]GGD28595.1 hypothetical protein GCM10007231_30140 [Nocardioides daphniae]